MSESQGPANADPVRAADLYRQAAEKGHPFAALRYGLALTDGIGIKRDPAAAQRWLVQAQDERRARGRAGAGRHGGAHARVARQGGEREDRANWRSTGTRSLPTPACRRPSSSSPTPTFAGVGVARDPAQARLWYSRAAQQGLPKRSMRWASC